MRGRGNIKVGTKVAAALTAVSALTGMTLTHPAGAQDTVPTSDTTKSKPTDPADGLDLTTAAGVKTFLRRVGLPVAAITGAAANLGIDADTFYEKVAFATRDNQDAKPTVELVGGKVRYNSTVTDSTTFLRTQRRSQTGEKRPDGCRFPSAAQGGDIGTNVVSEVVEFDPAQCTRTVFDGAYDPAAVAAASPPVAARAATGAQWLNCSVKTAAPALYQPESGWVDGEHRKYYKQSFVDPVCITITSTSLNGRWKNAVNNASAVTVLGVTADRYYFRQLGEQWPTSQAALFTFPAPLQSATQTPEGTMRAFHIRTETDFPEHLATVTALAGLGPFAVTYALCGFDFSDTTFESDQWILGGRNGTWRASGYGDVRGGCSTLVHERVWHGNGSFAR